jgi:hypothetical protein
MHISINEFVTALVCELRRRKVTYLSPSRDLLEPSVVAALQVLERHPKLEPRFVIIPHFLHGDSSELRRALAGIRHIIGYPINDDRLRICIGIDDAEALLETQPIPREVCEEMGEAFLIRYRGEMPAPATATART